MRLSLGLDQLKVTHLNFNLLSAQLSFRLTAESLGDAQEKLDKLSNYITCYKENSIADKAIEAEIYVLFGEKPVNDYIILINEIAQLKQKFEHTRNVIGLTTRILEEIVDSPLPHNNPSEPSRNWCSLL